MVRPSAEIEKTVPVVMVSPMKLKPVVVVSSVVADISPPDILRSPSVIVRSPAVMVWAAVPSAEPEMMTWPVVRAMAKFLARSHSGNASSWTSVTARYAA